jgi:hypothetical protein
MGMSSGPALLGGVERYTGPLVWQRGLHRLCGVWLAVCGCGEKDAWAVKYPFMRCKVVSYNPVYAYQSRGECYGLLTVSLCMGFVVTPPGCPLLRVHLQFG